LENILIQWTKARSGFNTRKRGRRRRRRRTVTSQCNDQHGQRHCPL